LVKKALNIPLIAAGGIGSGPAMLAAMALGADGVQVGSRFVATPEASSHPHFKSEVLKAEQGSTELTLKELTPVRLLKNPFYDQIKKLYAEGASSEKLKEVLGRGRAKKGMFEGDLVEGELEIGQVAAQIESLLPAETIVQKFIATYNTTLERLAPLD
jgi:enoyl-[acyl-carrier protein] reductase II